MRNATNAQKCDKLYGDGAVGGLASADTALSISDQATKCLKALSGAKLSAIRCVGGLTSFAGAALTVRSGIKNSQHRNYGILALNAPDLTVTGPRVLCPEIPPAVIADRALRTIWYIGSTLGQARRSGFH